MRSSTLAEVGGRTDVVLRLLGDELGRESQFARSLTLLWIELLKKRLVDDLLKTRPSSLCSLSACKSDFSSKIRREALSLTLSSLLAAYERLAITSKRAKWILSRARPTFATSISSDMSLGREVLSQAVTLRREGRGRACIAVTPHPEIRTACSAHAAAYKKSPPAFWPTGSPLLHAYRRTPARLTARSTSP